MVKTRRATHDQAREEDEAAFAHGYPTRARENALGSCAKDQWGLKIGPNGFPVEMKGEAANSVVAILASTRELASKQLKQIERLDAAMKHPASLLPTSGLSDADQLFLCQICSHAFDHATRQPLCLPCGHTICKECTKMIRASNVRGLCPFDRKDFTPVIDGLPVNSSVSEMLDGRMQRAKQVCCEHYRPYVGLCLTTRKLVCGVCLINSTDPHCFPFGTDEVEKYRTAVFHRLSSLKMKGENYLMLWKHVQELLELYTEDQRDVYGSIYSQRHLAEILNDIAEKVEDIAGLIEMVTAEVEERLSQLVQAEQVWETLTVAEQLSLQLDDVYKTEDVTEMLTLARQLLAIPMCVSSNSMSISSAPL